MKKQIVAILVAIAVLASLLTVSVLSEEAYKPIIQSVTVSPTEIVNGGVVTFTVTAKSNAPVNSVCYTDSTSPNKRICLGGGTCTNVGDDLWKCEWTRVFSEWAPAATYIYSHIYVINEGELKSDEWPHSISFNVTRTPVPTPTPVTPTPPEEEGFGGYRVTPCDAIDISLENATVTDFLNATNMTTVQVYNFKGYKGENCWMVQWCSANKSLNVYVNVTTGTIIGIEELIYPIPSPTPLPMPTPTPTVAPTKPEILSHSSYIDSLGYFNVVGEVKNTLPSNIKYVKIVTTFYDAQKKVIGTSFTYTELDILKPNQKSPFELSSYPDKIDPASYKLKVSYSETNEEPFAGLTILSHNANIDDLGYHKIVGEVKNDGTKEATYVKVVCTYYSAGGEVIGTSFTYTDPEDIDTGDSAPFELSSYPRELRPSSYDLQVQGK
jgi:hypothetical protein